MGLVSTSPWLRGVDQFGGGIIACAHLCMQGWALFFGLLSALPGGYFYQAVYIVSALWGGPILQIDGAALTLRGARVGSPGLACSNLCDEDWLCSWLASFL